MAKRTWSDLTSRQQQLVIVGGAIEALLTLTAFVDLARRPAARVRGPKVLWVLASVVQPVGPLAYFTVGRI